jgi:hypothetical protein
LNFLANEVNCIFVAKVKNMATLSGQKVKNAFASLLKLTTNTATTSLKNVESGDGVATALQLATGRVGINGTLEFPTAPATGSTEVKALLLNASNQVVERSLNAAAFSGGALTTASLPLAVSGSDVRMANPSSISDIGTPASGDRFLIYDASVTTWKRIDYSALSALINPGGYQSAPELVARTSNTLSLTSSHQYLEFENIGTASTESNKIGDATTYFDLNTAYGGTNDAIEFYQDGGIYQITICAPITTGGGAGCVVEFNFAINGAVVNVNETTLGTGTAHFITQSTFANLNAGDLISVTAAETGSGTVSIDQYAILHIRKL